MAVLELERPKKKVRRVNKSGKKRHSKSTQLSLAKFLTSMANESILFEIFTRLPNFRAVDHCAAVCKQWRSVITQPQFIPTFKAHHQKRSPPFTLMLRVGDSWSTGKRRDFQELFSEDSKILHGSERSIAEAEYLDFLPPKYTEVRASNKDLLLVTQSNKSSKMCVCNPLTRQWVPLPNPPFLLNKEYYYDHDIYNYALLCDPNSERHHYTVVIFRTDWSPVIRAAAVFRSETGRWDESVWTFSLRDRLDPLPDVAIGTIDGAIYIPLLRGMNYEKIAVFDPFDARRGHGFREISLPDDFHCGWSARHSRCQFGAVRGRLRLCLSHFSQTNDDFVFKVWQLNKKYGDWEIVHDLSLPTTGIHKSKFLQSSVVIALHPYDDDVFFLKDSRPNVWEYRIGTGSCKSIGEIDQMWRDAAVYTLVHQSRPTEISHFDDSV